MTTGSKILLAIWIVLAIASLVSTIWMPTLLMKIIGYSFGTINIGLIAGLCLLNADEKRQEKERLLESKL